MLRTVALYLAAPWLALLLLSCGGPATGTDSTVATKTTAAAADHKPFLWRIERGEAVSYAFGTIHTGVALADVSPVVSSTLDRCDTLVVEADSNDVGGAEGEDLVRLPPDQSLRSMLGEPYWAKLVEALGHQRPPEMLDRYRPWLISIMITLGEYLDSQAPSLDDELVRRARAADKTMVYLERPIDQAAMLNQILDIDALKETLDDVATARQGLTELIRAYLAGDFETLSALVIDPEEMAEDPETLDALLFARNRAWMTILVPLLQRGNVFIAVGAGHFAGDDGLLGLLRRAGYSVHRVSAGGRVLVQ